MRYQIGEFSKIARLSIKTLRYYHEIGLLIPTNIDPLTGYRYFDESCLEKARIINSLRSLEFSLTEIKEILENCTEDSDIREYMKKKLLEVERELVRYGEMRQKIDSFITLESEDQFFESGIILIKDVQDVNVVSIRMKGKYSEISNYLNVLSSRYGALAEGNPFSLFYDDDSIEEADIEICLPINSNANVPSKIIKGGKALSLIHNGPYETLYKSYRLMVDYINANKLQTASPVREIYTKGPGVILKRQREKYITEIQFILIEDDCKSIGGAWQMCIKKVNPEIKEKILSIVVPEFKGIDNLPIDIEQLKTV